MAPPPCDPPPAPDWQWLDQCATAALRTDAEGRVVCVNAALLRLLALEGPERRKPFTLDLGDGARAAELNRAIREAHVRGETWQGTVRPRRGDGSRICVTVTSHPLRSPGGELMGGLAFLQQADPSPEEATGEVHLSGGDLLRQTGDAVIVTDLDGRITAWHGGSGDLFGHRFEDVHGQHVADILYRTEVREQIRRSIRESLIANRVFSGEVVCVTKSGEDRLCLATVSQIRDHTGCPVAALAIYKDITELRRHERELLRTQQLESLGTLAGGIAHDFNNILVGILGFASLIKSQISPDERIWGQVENIEQSAERAARLTHQLLAYSRSANTVHRIVDLNSVVDEALVVLRATLKKTSTILTELASAPALVEADPIHLQQAILNLCVNADEAMPTAGEITITTRVEANDEARSRVVLEVSDTGLGMGEETMARAFEPFFSTKELGRGLGLAAVYGIARQHRGEVTIEATPGRGTRVRMSMPHRPEPSQVTSASESRRTRTILIAEDEEIIRELLSSVLEPGGHRVILTADGQEAIDVVDSHRDEIDLALIDIMMPRRSGYDVYTEIRRGSPDMPIIMSSGLSDSQFPTAVTRDQNVRFIRKPYRFQELVRQVDRCLGIAEGT
jgi:PAS domain S-box-containing protein